MGDRTRNIWNDDDGESALRQREKKHPLRRLGLFLLIVLAVLAVVLVAAWRDGTGFDALLRRFAYGSAQSESGTVSFTYDAANNNRFAVLGDGLAVLSGTQFQVLDSEGKQVYSATVKMENPALTVGGGRAVAYDVGGTELYAADLSGELFHLTADSSEPLIDVTVNEKGWMAVTAEKKSYKGSVRVYDSEADGEGDEVFEFKSSKRFLVGAYVTDDCKSLAAVTLGQSSSVFISDVILYDLDEEEPRANYNIRNGLVLAIGEKGGRLAAVTDTGLTFGTTAGEAAETYGFSGQYLREYDLGGDGYTALLLNRYQSGSVGRLVTVGDDGQEIAFLDVREQVLSISAAGRYLAVLYTDKLVIYNPELQEYATLTGTNMAKEALVREDGSALLISSENARLFLP